MSRQTDLSVRLVGVQGLGSQTGCLRGQHASCRSLDAGNRPVWLDRSVASPPLRCAHRPVPSRPLDVKGDWTMITVGIDAHKRTHTVVAVDELGREIGHKTTATTSDDHLELLRWAERFGDERTWAVEDCRHLSRRSEADLLAAGERLVRGHQADGPRPRRGAHLRQVGSDRRVGRGAGRIAAPRLADRTPRRSRTRAAIAGRPSRRPGRRADTLHQPAALADARTRSQLGSPGSFVAQHQELRCDHRGLAGLDTMVAGIAREIVALGRRSHAPATASSTPPSTASPSRRCAATITPRPTSSAGSPPGTRRPKHCAPSSAACPTSSIEPCSSTPKLPPRVASPRRLDIGANHAGP